jgi:excisionase family DNA binding protein
MKLITINEVATRLKVSPRTIQRTIARGELKPVRISQKVVRLVDTEVDQWIESRPRTRSRQPKQLRKDSHVQPN